ncbi:carboxypeptidase-like regulatory domain-containing protein [Fulvivirga sp. 29W222]|uniref:Carboxypeptidase-like regulatory domain-containing protein n=1 Tax=Fulvivirga marina TaxID=2494733 RepID=A0A937G2E0_9BACT|nr:carboxypeptidase-like regulatory domain-containing protein [Fulvivirga marina]MBL6448725.1 carboxypeptidase-like regulatory domain-containing protein [Fulvivirga marina]
MTRYFFSILVSLLFSITLVFGQDKNIEITGTIIEAGTKEPVPYVHIVNRALGKGTVSNTEGRFWINMTKSDTIQFSAIGFEPYMFTLKEQVTTDRINVTIELNTSTMELQPVKVFAYKDEQALKKAMIAMDVPIESEKKGIQLPGFYYGPTKEVKPNLMNPISFIHSKFSREVKEQRKLAEYQQQENYQNLIKAKYNESVVIELTGLPEDKVEEFMNFCKLEDSFIGRATEYEIAVAVNRCLNDFEAIEEGK